MFRCRQKIQYSASSNCSLPSTTYSDDGFCVDRFVTGHESLPDPENFKIKNLLKAGVALEQVNTKVIDSGVVDLSNLSKPVAQPAAAPAPAAKPVAQPAETST